MKCGQKQNGLAELYQSFETDTRDMARQNFDLKCVQRVTVSELVKVRRDKEPYTGWGF